MSKNSSLPEVTFKKRFKELNTLSNMPTQCYHWLLAACNNATEFLVFVRLLIN